MKILTDSSFPHEKLGTLQGSSLKSRRIESIIINPQRNITEINDCCML